MTPVAKEAQQAQLAPRRRARGALAPANEEVRREPAETVAARGSAGAESGRFE